MNSATKETTGRGPAADLRVMRPDVPGTILVVEDEPEILAPLSHALKRAGYLVLEADDGLKACRMIAGQQPDLVLLDIMLPDLSGWDLCRFLRRHPDPHVADTPVIMLTALNSAEDRRRGLELGADAYIPKPYSQQEVLQISGQLIDRHRRRLLPRITGERGGRSVAER